MTWYSYLDCDAVAMRWTAGLHENLFEMGQCDPKRPSHQALERAYHVVT